MTRDAFLVQINSISHSLIHKVTVGAAIIGNRATPRILLLKRNASEPNYPNVFEIPGGKVEASDASIRDAVAREVFEETRLTVTSVLSALSPIRYTTEKTVIDGSGETRTTQCRTTQLSYVVAIEEEDGSFIVNPEGAFYGRLGRRQRA